MAKDIQVGDTIRILRTVGFEIASGIKKGEEYEVVNTGSGTIYVESPIPERIALWTKNVEKVWNGKMTFIEMIDRVIAGEFPVGTELKCEMRHSSRRFYIATNDDKNYGLTTKPDGRPVASLGPSMFKGKWSVVEKVKELTLEEVEKELGYKVKIIN